MSQVNEISKGTIGSYLKKTPASAALAGNKMADQSMNPKDSMKKGVKGIVKRSKGVSMAVDKMTGKSKVPATESVSEAKFVIPESLPKMERNAFHRMAADAHKSGRSHFSFQGKKYPVTIDPDYASTVRGEQKEASDDAMKAYLAKGGKITKLPPGKAQGYHGKDDPGKDVAGTMSSDDSKSMGTKKKVKSMEKKDDSVIMNPTMKKDKKDSNQMSYGETKEEAHPMYKDGKKVMVKTKADHDKYAKMGYTMKESIRYKLMSVLENDRAMHYKGATPPEEMDSKMSPGGKKMKADMEKGMTPNDDEKKGQDDAAAAGRVTKVAPKNTTDKNAPGDTKVVSPVRKESLEMNDKKVLKNIASAYLSMYEQKKEGEKDWEGSRHIKTATTTDYNFEKHDGVNHSGFPKGEKAHPKVIAAAKKIKHDDHGIDGMKIKGGHELHTHSHDDGDFIHIHHIHNGEHKGTYKYNTPHTERDYHPGEGPIKKALKHAPPHVIKVASQHLNNTEDELHRY